MVSQSGLATYPGGKPGGEGVRITYPLQKHLLHIPERAHSPFHLDHGADVHPAQIDGAICSRDAFCERISIRLAVVCWFR